MKCKDCFWYSDETVIMCERDSDETEPDWDACKHFEQKEVQK